MTPLPIAPPFRLTWIAQTTNSKTGNIPSAYVGETFEECRKSCEGCPLLDDLCYAQHGLAVASLMKIEERRKTNSVRFSAEYYSLDGALSRRHPSARAARIGAMGDPARANPMEIERAKVKLDEAGLVLLSYTHFWRESSAQHLRSTCLASCEDVSEADEAISMGWIAALLLPWDYLINNGPRITTPEGRSGFVCLAETKETTCNECRLCWTGHPVWAAGKVDLVGFVDHSRAALRERSRHAQGAQGLLFGDRPDLRPPPRK